MFACPIQSWTRSTPNPLDNKSGAAMLEHVEMPELLRDAGRSTVLLHQQVERRAVDRPLLLRQEDRARSGASSAGPPLLQRSHTSVKIKAVAAYSVDRPGFQRSGRRHAGAGGRAES